MTLFTASKYQGENVSQLMAEPMSHRHDGRTPSAVERIAAFATAARPEHLTTNIRQLFKRNILDSLGCAIAAFAGFTV
jgi:hypothetical protein